MLLKSNNFPKYLKMYKTELSMLPQSCTFLALYFCSYSREVFK